MIILKYVISAKPPMSIINVRHIERCINFAKGIIILRSVVKIENNINVIEDSTEVQSVAKKII